MGDGKQADTWKPNLTWKHSRGWAIVLIILYAMLALAPVVAASLTRSSDAARGLHAWALNAALLGFTILTLQAVLASRFRWIDQAFGLDRVMKFHKYMAFLATALLLLHPLLLTLWAGDFRFLSLSTNWKIWLGKLALFIVIFGVAYAMLVRLWNLQYQTWRRLHKGMIVVVILAFAHGLLLGSDLRSAGMLAYWIALFAVAALIYAWRNLVLPFWGHRRYRVAEVNQMSHDTWSLVFEPSDGKPAPRHNPGQFMFLNLRRPGRPSEEHPFTISAAPTESDSTSLMATIKQSGDFTDTIDKTKVGDEARIEAPFGRFSYVHHDAGKFLFIAGGVGITPIRSMLRTMADTGDDRPVKLIYANTTEADILFREEISHLGDSVGVTHVLSEPGPDWQGPAGFVTREILAEHADGFLGDAHVFLCGPPPMMDKVEEALKTLGVSDSKIHTERFSL